MTVIRQVREEVGLTQAAFGALFKVGQSSVAHWEARQREPRPVVAKAIVRFAASKDIEINLSDIYQ